MGGSVCSKQLLLVKFPIFIFLILDVLLDGRLVSSHRGHEVSTRPETLAFEVPFLAHVGSRDIDGALALDEPHYLSNRVFRRYEDHHVNMIQQQFALYDVAFTLPSQIVEHLAEMFTNFSKQPLPTVLGNEHNVVDAIPFRVALAFVVFHVSLHFVEL